MLVVAFSFSVGTARLYSCNSPFTDTAGLTRACAEAAAGANSARAATADAVSARRVAVGGLAFTFVFLSSMVGQAPLRKRHRHCSAVGGGIGRGSRERVRDAAVRSVSCAEPASARRAAI